MLAKKAGRRGKEMRLSLGTAEHEMRDRWDSAMKVASSTPESPRRGSGKSSHYAPAMPRLDR